MDIDLKGIIIIVGNYGSGKTEVAINLAVQGKKSGKDVRIADLDLVNTYFRTREARNIFKEFEIDLVLPPDEYMHADLPILSPIVGGLIRQPSELTIIDVGGDNVGAIVLSALSDKIKQQSVAMLQVVNPYRPYTDTIEGCLIIKNEIEIASRISVSGFIGNPNLIDDTKKDTIYEGYDFVKSLSETSGLPIFFISIDHALLKNIEENRFSCPVLPIQRQLVPPWKKAMKFGS